MTDVTRRWARARPFGAQDEIMRDLASSVFEGKSFKFHHATKEGGRTVATYGPARGSLAH